jgi:hypothetical protein
MEILSSECGTTVKALIPINACRSKAFAAPSESAALTDAAEKSASLIDAIAKRATVN